jgi:glycosyltransferase involved in cell wall biosynthesis
MTIGIAITGFGCGHYLAEAMSSVQAQSDRDWSCAVIYDPAEHDAVVRRMAEEDTRFVPLPSELICVSSARNQAFAHIGGDLLIALDGDDVLARDYVTVLRGEMSKDPHVRVAYTGTVFFGMQTGVKPEIPYSRRSLATRNMIVSSAMFRRADFLAVGGYDPHPQNLCEDWELWVSILKSGGGVSFTPKTLFNYRQRAQSRWHSMSVEQHRSAREYIFQKHADFCWHRPLSRTGTRSFTAW